MGIRSANTKKTVINDFDANGFITVLLIFYLEQLNDELNITFADKARQSVLGI